MPSVEVTVAEVGEKTTESDDATHQERPPRPSFPLFQRKGRQPEVKHSNPDQGSGETDAIMKHEVDDAAFIDAAQILGRHLQEVRIVRQEMTSCRLKKRKTAR